MSKFALFMLFFLACLSVFGQPSDRELKLFVLPIAGYGKEADNDYFYKQLAYEVFFQYHKVVKSQDSSDYIFKGTIEPVGGAPVKEPADGQTDKYNPIPENTVPPIRNYEGRREFFSIENGSEIYFFDSTGENNSRSSGNVQAEEEGYYFKLEMIDRRTGFSE